MEIIQNMAVNDIKPASNNVTQKYTFYSIKPLRRVATQASLPYINKGVVIFAFLCFVLCGCNTQAVNIGKGCGFITDSNAR